LAILPRLASFQARRSIRRNEYLYAALHGFLRRFGISVAGIRRNHIGPLTEVVLRAFHHR